MNNSRSTSLVLSVTLLALSTFIALGCGLELEVDDETNEISSERYVIDWFASDAASLHGGASSPFVHCNHKPNGVVSKWRLDEINVHDFRGSRLYCTEMGISGTLSGSTDWIDHFRYPGSSTISATSVPMGMLPRGLRVRQTRKSGSPTGYKVSNTALLYSDAASIDSSFSSFSQAGWATTRTRGSVYDLLCHPGTVLTGIGVDDVADAGGPNRSEIVDIYIRCERLDRVPLNGHGHDDIEPIDQGPQ